MVDWAAAWIPLNSKSRYFKFILGVYLICLIIFWFEQILICIGPPDYVYYIIPNFIIISLGHYITKICKFTLQSSALHFRVWKRESLCFSNFSFICGRPPCQILYRRSNRKLLMTCQCQNYIFSQLHISELIHAILLKFGSLNKVNYIIACV